MVEECVVCTWTPYHGPARAPNHSTCALKMLLVRFSLSKILRHSSRSGAPWLQTTMFARRSGWALLRLPAWIHPFAWVVVDVMMVASMNLLVMAE